jgi:hypothetical protein
MAEQTQLEPVKLISCDGKSLLAVNDCGGLACLGFPSHTTSEYHQLTPLPPEMQGCMAAVYEWACSYDTKDWDRLAKCIAPTLRIDYRSFLNKIWEEMPADEFVKMASDPKVLGDKCLMTLGRDPPARRRQGPRPQLQHPLVQEGQWRVEVRRLEP